jgi:hypothetical protein
MRDNGNTSDMANGVIMFTLILSKSKFNRDERYTGTMIQEPLLFLLNRETEKQRHLL